MDLFEFSELLQWRKKGEKKNDPDNYTIPSHTEFMDIERLNGTAASLPSTRPSIRPLICPSTRPSWLPHTDAKAKWTEMASSSIENKQIFDHKLSLSMTTRCNCHLHRRRGWGMMPTWIHAFVRNSPIRTYCNVLLTFLVLGSKCSIPLAASRFAGPVNVRT